MKTAIGTQESFPRRFNCPYCGTPMLPRGLRHASHDPHSAFDPTYRSKRMGLEFSCPGCRMELVVTKAPSGPLKED